MGARYKRQNWMVLYNLCYSTFHVSFFHTIVCLANAIIYFCVFEREKIKFLRQDYSIMS